MLLLQNQIGKRVETFVKLVQKKGRGPPQQDHHHGCPVKAKAIASCT